MKANTDSLLQVSDLTIYYGEIRAVGNVSFELRAGETFVIVGSNGAGKTSIMRAIMGLHRPRSGSIRFKGKVINNLPTFQIARLGIALVPEGRELFTNLTVEQNLALGGRMHRTEVAIAEIYDRFPVLKERRKQVAGTLSGGEQQILALARVLMRKAELILLDEPSVGMMPAKVNELFEMISSMRGSVTILLVEQNAEKALQLADSALVLELGQVVLEGPGELIRSDPKVRSAYLPE